MVKMIGKVEEWHYTLLDWFYRTFGTSLDNEISPGV